MTRAKLKALLLLSFLALLLLLGFLGFFNKRENRVGEALKPTLQLEHSEMEELSGLVASQQHPGVLWAHNDSGNAPVLFALSTDGEVLVPDGLPVEEATLKDWEAIARWKDTLYITEMGNNLNASRQLGIYELEEPNPAEVSSVKPKRFLKVRYPDQTGFPPTDVWEFDCEAAFCWQGKLYFITKNRPAFRLFVQAGSANLYRLDLDKLSEDNVLERVDRVEQLGGWVTAADMSSDGRWLALVTESPTQSLWLFERPLEGDKFFSRAQSVKRFPFWDGGQLESLTFAEFEGEDVLVMVNEEREFFRIPLDKFEEVPKP